VISERAGVGMSEVVVSLSTFDELRSFVRKTLCEQDALDQAQTPFYQTPILRRGRTMGVLFHVEGPRLLKTSAMWMSDEGRIVFYNSSGQRMRDVKLSEGPEIPIQNAAA
jgi:hypothetical protein